MNSSVGGAILGTGLNVTEKRSSWKTVNAIKNLLESQYLVNVNKN